MSLWRIRVILPWRPSERLAPLTPYSEGESAWFLGQTGDRHSIMMKIVRAGIGVKTNLLAFSAAVSCPVKLGAGGEASAKRSHKAGGMMVADVIGQLLNWYVRLFQKLSCLLKALT